MSEPIHCPDSDCKHYIGEDIVIEGLHLLQIGGVLLWEMRGACPKCGRILYWSVRDRAVERAIKQSKSPEAPH